MNSTKFSRRALLHAAGATALVAGTGGAFAQSYPSKPLRIVHGYNSGSNPDTIGRIVGPTLGEKIGQNVVVEPKPGAAGRIATAYVAGQEPDGYTMMMLTGGDTVTAAFDSKLTYDLLRDYAFVATVVQTTLMVVVAAQSPLKSFADLLEAAKKPAGLTFGTPGVGTTQHLTGELLKATANLNLVMVPFRGNAFPDLIGGRLDFMIAAPSVSLPHIKSGSVRALAVTGRDRIESAREVPAVGETLQGFDVTSWLGLAVPAKTPPAIVEKLSGTMRAVLADQPTRQRLLATGSDVGSLIGNDFRARVQSDIAKWRTLVGKVKLEM